MVYLERMFGFVLGVGLMAVLALSLSIRIPDIAVKMADHLCNRNEGVNAIKVTIRVHWREPALVPEYQVTCRNTAEFRGLTVQDGAPPPAREALDTDRVLRGG